MALLPQGLRTVGILGGMGPDATVLLMHRILQKVHALDDSDHIPLIVMQNPQVPSRIAHLIHQTGESPAPILANMASGATDTHRTTPIQHMIMHCNRALCGTIYHTCTRSTTCVSNVSVASLPACAAACVRRQKSHWLFCRARLAHARRTAAELVNLGRT